MTDEKALKGVFYVTAKLEKNFNFFYYVFEDLKAILNQSRLRVRGKKVSSLQFCIRVM